MCVLPQAAELAEYSAKIAELEEAKRTKEEEADSWHSKVSLRAAIKGGAGSSGGAGKRPNLTSIGSVSYFPLQLFGFYDAFQATPNSCFSDL